MPTHLALGVDVIVPIVVFRENRLADDVVIVDNIDSVERVRRVVDEPRDFQRLFVILQVRNAI